MTGLRRVFKHVWPQWPRLIVVFVTAVIVAILLSVSFLTIIPLLKVMLGQEGLHGWIDRKSCDYKYGVEFYVPDVTDITSGSGEEIAYSLFVTNVEQGSLAEAAGLKAEDRIIGAGKHPSSEVADQIPASTILEDIATTSQNEITVQVKRTGGGGFMQRETLRLHTPADESYVNGLEWSDVRKTKWSLKLAVINRAQWAVGFLPRGQNPSSKRDAVLFIILLVGAITVVRCLAKFYQSYMAQKVMLVAIKRIREDAFGHAIEIPMSFFANKRPTDTISRIIHDTNQMAASIKIMLGRALREPMNALFMLICALLLSWQLVLIFICAAPFVIGLVIVFGRKMKKATKKSLMAGSQMLAKLQGTMSGLKVVKVYNQQEYERKSFKVINNKLLKQSLKIAKVNSATMPVLEVLGMFSGVMALMAGVHWVTQSKMGGAEFFGLLILLGAAAEAVRKSSGVWNKIQEAKAASERVFAIIDEPAEEEAVNAYQLERLKNKIEFVNVTFRYPGDQSTVLKGVSLSVQAGHNVAIVGPNGSGKTTLANLIPRFYDPEAGQILIDGKDIRGATLLSLRSQISMVTQQVITFNDTISANIAYGKSTATFEEIEAAARRSFAHEFIVSFPKGYDTVIGEQGTGLSGGQLQRIIIARAILKDPAILIFDEATSQVDADSEAKIHNAIEQIMRDRTSFVIAHRFSTVITADVIVVMDKGQIIAQGTHDKLMETCSLYRSLYKTQLVTT